MKKQTMRLSAFVCVVAVTLLFSRSYAVEYVPYIAMQVDCPSISINGNVVPIDDRNTAPVIRDGSLLLPIAAVVNAVNQLSQWNLSVQWDAGAQKVSIVSDHPALELWIGKTTAVIDGAVRELKAAPLIIGGSAMVPHGVISESLGLHVEWRDDNRGILISFSSSGFPVDIVFPAPPGQYEGSEWNNNPSKFRPVQSREELHGIWEHNDIDWRGNKVQYSIRIEDTYLVSYYSMGGSVFANRYSVSDGMLSYSYAYIYFIDELREGTRDTIIEKATRDNVTYNSNDFYYYSVDWEADISEDGNTLRLSSVEEYDQMYHPGEYRIKMFVFEKIG